MWYSGTPARDGVASVTDGVLTLTEVTTEQVAAENADALAALKALNTLVSAPDFPTGNRQEFPFDDEEEVDGMFDGVPGTYTCTESAGCSFMTDKDGDLAAVSDGWTFEAEEVETGAPPHMVFGVDDDDDYLYFGYWLQATEGEDGTTYAVSTFSGGAMPFGGENPSTTISDLLGTAKYAGSAAGKFVRKTFDSDGVGTPTSAGSFSRDGQVDGAFWWRGRSRRPSIHH